MMTFELNVSQIVEIKGQIGRDWTFHWYACRNIDCANETHDFYTINDKLYDTNNEIWTSDSSVSFRFFELTSSVKPFYIYVLLDKNDGSEPCSYYSEVIVVPEIIYDKQCEPCPEFNETTPSTTEIGGTLTSRPLKPSNLTSLTPMLSCPPITNSNCMNGTSSEIDNRNDIAVNAYNLLVTNFNNDVATYNSNIASIDSKNNVIATYNSEVDIYNDEVDNFNNQVNTVNGLNENTDCEECVVMNKLSHLNYIAFPTPPNAPNPINCEECEALCACPDGITFVECGREQELCPKNPCDEIVINTSEIKNDMNITVVSIRDMLLSLVATPPIPELGNTITIRINGKTYMFNINNHINLQQVAQQIYDDLSFGNNNLNIIISIDCDGLPAGVTNIQVNWQKLG